MRITHSVFRHNPDNLDSTTPLPFRHLFIKVIHDSVYIANNQFYSDETTSNVIYVSCATQCDQQNGTLTIQNNQWLAPAPSQAESDNPALEAIFLQNIPKAVITDNEEIDPGARSSIRISYFLLGTSDQSINLNISDNLVLPQSSSSSRQLRLTAQQFDPNAGSLGPWVWVDAKMDGRLILSGNNCYEITKKQGFLTSQALRIIEEAGTCLNASGSGSGNGTSFENTFTRLVSTTTPVFLLSSIMRPSGSTSSSPVAMETSSILSPPPSTATPSGSSSIQGSPSESMVTPAPASTSGSPLAISETSTPGTKISSSIPYSMPEESVSSQPPGTASVEPASSTVMSSFSTATEKTDTSSYSSSASRSLSMTHVPSLTQPLATATPGGTRQDMGPNADVIGGSVGGTAALVIAA
ncbi:MAG: hypothetical protein ACR2PT_18655, partial [Endozoicomonas sp.]